GDGADPAAATILAVAAGHAGVTVAADHVHLQDIRIRRADAQYSAGIQVTTTLTGLTLTRVSVLGAQRGLWVSTEGDVTGLAVTDSHFDENQFGWYLQKASPNDTSVRQLQVTDSTFYSNTDKGFYAEKLDHALLDRIAVRSSGVNPADDAKQALGLELKWGNYTNLTIQNSLFEASGAYGTASQPYLPAAVVLVARSELSGSLAGVTFTHNSLSGLENALRIGDLGHPGPQQVSVTQNRLLGANGAGNTGYGLILASTAAVTATLNWWGDRTGPKEAANLFGVGSAITATSGGLPLYRPWLSSGNDSDPATTGFQPVFPQDRYGLLVGLTLPASALVPEFATSTAHYTTTVQRTADRLVVTPTVAAGYAATVTVNGGAVAAGSASAILPLTVTLPTPISITVTGVDGWTQVYTLTAEIRCLDVVHVNRAATGPDKNGIGWASAWNDLQDALRSPRTCGGVSELWVASGVYTPGLTATATFSIPAGVAVYGGFAATETTRDQRDWRGQRTVLSGDLAGDDRADVQGVVTSTSLLTGTNAYHVVWLEGTPSAPITGTTRLDGFVVTAGNASGGSSPHNRGGGLFCLSNGSPCSPALSNLFFSANRAAAFGGAIYLDGRGGGASSPTITHSEFRSNSAGSGGAIYNHGLEGSSSPALVNTIFYANSANTGGAVYNNGSDGDSSPSFRQVTFAANSATTGGALYLLEAGSPQLTNTILWGNTASAGGAQLYLAAGAASPQPAIQFSIVQGGESGSNSGTAFSAGVGNLDRDPLFANRASGDLRLLAGSPAIDVGSNSGAPADDLRGLPRPVQAQVDIGAYETQGFTLTVSGGSGQSARIGQLFAEPLTVTLTSPTEPVGPGAVLTVTAPASGAGLAASSPYTVAGNSSGVGSTAVRANLLAGSYGVTVTARGVAVPAVFSLSNQPSPTAIQLAGAPPALYGAAVVLTATVTATLEGAGVPAGVVTFTAAAGALGVVPLNASGVATISTASLLAGTQRITATYGGNAHYLAIGPVTATQQVGQVSPAIGLGSAPTPSSYGRTVIFLIPAFTSGKHLEAAGRVCVATCNA
ncbi:MAG: choice-of-anchor Q domain-containing protein, partial [Caldilinea sp.]